MLHGLGTFPGMKLMGSICGWGKRYFASNGVKDFDSAPLDVGNDSFN